MGGVWAYPKTTVFGVLLSKSGLYLVQPVWFFKCRIKQCLLDVWSIPQAGWDNSSNSHCSMIAWANLWLCDSAFLCKIKIPPTNFWWCFCLLSDFKLTKMWVKYLPLTDVSVCLYSVPNSLYECGEMITTCLRIEQKFGIWPGVRKLMYLHGLYSILLNWSRL